MNIKEIAKLAGVSVASVSRTFHDEKVPILLPATELPDCPCTQITADDYNVAEQILREAPDITCIIAPNDTPAARNSSRIRFFP
ncbi:MAG: hypothetical protein BWY31_00389 [Lentisphaerae bacterium ADurb.Bin242]|nr:MAG: hypothetical protein BWY31_00389 [Lentisphaerae bacterium ADurb.Bin242]